MSYLSFRYLSISLHDICGYNYPIIPDGGWHLSYFGNADFIKNKIENFSHQELNINEYTNIDKINERMNQFIDLFDRNDYNNMVIKISIKDNDNLPPEYDIYLQKYIVF